jgi:PAS domain-containing protein
MMARVQFGEMSRRSVHCGQPRFTCCTLADALMSVTNAPPLPSQSSELEQLRQIFDRAPVMLYQWTLSPDGEARFTAVSRGCEQIYGIPPEQMLADIR